MLTARRRARRTRVPQLLGREALLQLAPLVHLPRPAELPLVLARAAVAAVGLQKIFRENIPKIFVNRVVRSTWRHAEHARHGIALTRPPATY